MREWRAAHERIGSNLEPGERMAIRFQFHIAKSKGDGMKEAAKYREENMNMFGELRLVKALTGEQIEAMRDPRLVPDVKLPRIEDAVKVGGFLAGTPDGIIGQLKAPEQRYPGPARVTVAQPSGLALSLCLEQLEWSAKDVVPAFGTA